MESFDLVVGRIYPTKINGDLKIIEKLPNSRFMIQFVDTGYTKNVQSKDIKCQSIKDILRPSRFGVGYLGQGYYKFRTNGKENKCSVTWKSMLERCYCPKYLAVTPTYKDCTVCDEWHNYQNFAKWFYDNYPEDDQEDYHLDKDSIVKGNKLYSPDTCTFLTKYDNVRISKEKDYIFVNPEGVVVKITNLAEYCRDKDLTRENMGKVHRGERPSHKGWTKYVE